MPNPIGASGCTASQHARPPVALVLPVDELPTRPRSGCGPLPEKSFATGPDWVLDAVAANRPPA
ncbi:hypothetical protein [Streptomyces griseorubiginosus]|uniref:hypothetical protein n=1 Tax=Streptomyces griseorubiginosus TaxID=67304 RepID=UPI0033F6D66E